LAEACNPRWHRPPDDVSPGDDGPGVVVAGNMYATRFSLLRRLQSAAIPVVVYGPAWPRWLPEDPALAAAYTGKYITREDKARVFRGATTVLNAMSAHEADGANCRLFEAAACGAVVVTDWRERLPSFFDVPQEVRAFRSFSELVEELRSIAELSPERRRAIGDAAAARAHADHSYARRFESLVEHLGHG
jgi:spore maturation protein CgeB